MAERSIESLHRLTAESATRGIRHSTAANDRNIASCFLAEVGDSLQCHLSVKRIEDGLYEQHVGAAVNESAGLLMISVIKLLEGNVALSRIVHVAAHRQRLIRRTHRAGDDNCFGVFVVPFLVCGDTIAAINRPLRTLRRCLAYLIHKVLQVIVAEREAVAVKRVRLYDVRPGLNVSPVHTDYGLRLGEAQHVVASLQRHRMVAEPFPPKVLLRKVQSLQICTSGAVENQDALAHYVKYFLSCHVKNVQFAS